MKTMDELITESLTHDTTVSNYFDSVNNLVYDLGRYIEMMRYNVPELYRVHKNGSCKSEVVDATSVFLLSEADNIIRDKCIRFAIDANELCHRKYDEVKKRLKVIADSGHADNKIAVSHDIIMYFNDIQQALDWDSLASGNYGEQSKLDDKEKIYDVELYLVEKQEELESIKFNTMINHSFQRIIEVVDFGYRESLNTFHKLRRLLDSSRSVYSSIIIVHVYIDILLLMCYIVGYIFNKSHVVIDG